MSETAPKEKLPKGKNGLVRLLHRLLKRRGRFTFVDSLPPHATILDIGCGNNSPIYLKTQRPDCYYIGLDVGDYNQDTHSKSVADEYVLTDPDRFPSAILHFQDRIDAVISSHNLEHCDAPADVLDAMIKCLKPGGRLYLTTPCEESVGFPRRRGTLNFFDDPTHKTVANWDETISKITREGLVFEFLAKRYRSAPLVLVGILIEPISALRRKVGPFCTTWSLYGFESLIWAYRPKK